jgi:hypothetical protein
MSDQLQLPSCTSCVQCAPPCHCKKQATLTLFVILLYAAILPVHAVVPGSAVVHVDVRTLPGQDEQYVLHHVKRALSGLRNADGTEYFYKVSCFVYIALLANIFCIEYTTLWVHACTHCMRNCVACSNFYIS